MVSKATDQLLAGLPELSDQSRVQINEKRDQCIASIVQRGATVASNDDPWRTSREIVRTTFDLYGALYVHVAAHFIAFADSATTDDIFKISADLLERMAADAWSTIVNLSGGVCDPSSRVRFEQDFKSRLDSHRLKVTDSWLRRRMTEIPTPAGLGRQSRADETGAARMDNDQPPTPPEQRVPEARRRGRRRSSDEPPDLEAGRIRSEWLAEKKAGMTWKEVEAKAGLTFNPIKHYREGKKTSDNVRAALAKAFGVPLSEVPK